MSTQSLIDVFLYDLRCYDGRESARFAIITVMISLSCAVLIGLMISVDIGKSRHDILAVFYNIFWVLIVCSVNSALLILIKWYFSLFLVPAIIFGMEKLNMIEIVATSKKNVNLSAEMKKTFLLNKWKIRIIQALIPCIILIAVSALNIF